MNDANPQCCTARSDPSWLSPVRHIRRRPYQELLSHSTHQACCIALRQLYNGYRHQWWHTIFGQPHSLAYAFEQLYGTQSHQSHQPPRDFLSNMASFTFEIIHNLIHSHRRSSIIHIVSSWLSSSSDFSDYPKLFALECFVLIPVTLRPCRQPLLLEISVSFGDRCPRKLVYLLATILVHL